MTTRQKRPKTDESEQPRIKPDDDRLSREVAPLWEKYYRYFNSEWKEYLAGAWETRDENEMRINLRLLMRNLRGERNWQIQISQGRVNGLLQMLQDDLYISDRVITQRQDESVKYINLRNGLFNLETMQLEKHNPDLYLTSRLDFDYDPDAHCPAFLAYLNKSLVLPNGKTDHKLIRLTCQALAYSMTARTDLKSSFWLVGAPDSGKSTFIAFIRSLMGSLHATIDLNQLATNRFLLSGIVGKRVVTFTEASGDTPLPDAIYKSMVGGEDEIMADVKNKPAIAFKPIAKFWWAMNSQPRINDRSGATFNRLQIIPFNRSIPRDERDPQLLSKLVAERSGIFNFILPDYRKLCATGAFEYVEQSIAKREQYMLDNDTERTFINECCTARAGARTQSQILYDQYKLWCERNGFRPKNVNMMRAEWERLGFSRHLSDGKVYYQGISLNS